MDENFVTFEIAKKLKEKGFPQRPDYFNYSSYYAWDGLRKIHSLSNASVWFDPNIDRENIYFAPTISQVLKWLREDKKMHIIIPASFDRDYWWEVRDFNRKLSEYSISELGTYEEAAIDGIKYVLDNLI
jgi:hypothetical protein